jgi:hypothetical protein
MVFEILTGALAVISIVLGIWAKHSKQAEVYFKKYKMVEEKILELIAVAEKFTSLTGEQKKEYVIEKIKYYMIELNINIPDSVIDYIIEDAISFSKKVNTK